jgi:catechol 2,3-dioxygenase-like lactoylglutathione lyase family enzyme
VAAAVPGIERIGQLALRIRDAQRATQFYRDVLGLEHLYTFGDLVFFDCAGTRLYLHRVAESDWIPGSVVYLVVADITSAYRGLSDAGVRFAEAPHLIHRHDSGTEEWMAFFDDSEGNTLALMSQVPPGADV